MRGTCVVKSVSASFGLCLCLTNSIHCIQIGSRSSQTPMEHIRIQRSNEETHENGDEDRGQREAKASTGRRQRAHCKEYPFQHMIHSQSCEQLPSINCVLVCCPQSKRWTERAETKQGILLVFGALKMKYTRNGWTAALYESAPCSLMDSSTRNHKHTRQQNIY